MGAWSELDTEISVDVETTDLDNIINMDDPYGIIKDEVYVRAQNIKENIVQGSKNGVKTLANFNRSQQEQIIAMVCDNPSGMLASSINDEMLDEFTYLIGTIIKHIYPLSVEKGRKGFSVKPPRKALAFYIGGELIFRKSVGPAKPRPFVAPAYDRTLHITDEVMRREIYKNLEK